MGEHGHWQKMTLFENAARVPLMIAAPQTKAAVNKTKGAAKTAGQHTESPVELVDIYPTLAEMCGLDSPQHLSGVSLAPLLDDPSLQESSAMPGRTALTQLQDGARRRQQTFFGYSIRTLDKRYTEWGTAGRKGVELYDHASDPEELVNVAEDPAYAETVSKLSQTLRRRVEQAQKVPDGLGQIPEEHKQ